MNVFCYKVPDFQQVYNLLPSITPSKGQSWATLISDTAQKVFIQLGLKEPAKKKVYTQATKLVRSSSSNVLNQHSFQARKPLKNTTKLTKTVFLPRCSSTKFDSVTNSRSLAGLEPFEKATFDKALKQASFDFFVNRINDLSQREFSRTQAKNEVTFEDAHIFDLPKKIQDQVMATAKNHPRLEEYFEERLSEGTDVLPLRDGKKRRGLDPKFVQYDKMRRKHKSFFVPIKYFANPPAKKAIDPTRKFQFPSATAFVAKSILSDEAQKILKKLGQGSTSACYLKQLGKECFAVKAEGIDEYTLEEVDLHLSLLPHKNIIDLRAARKDLNSRKYEMYMEVADTSLDSMIKDKKINSQNIVSLLHGVAAGLAHMHAKGVMHCDLKPDNILVKDGVAKIADFNMSSKDISNTSGGAIVISSPEMIHYMSDSRIPKRNKFKDVNVSTDVWSFGINIFNLLTRRHYPYNPGCGGFSQGLSRIKKIQEEKFTSSEATRKFFLDALKPYSSQVKELDPSGELREIMLSCLNPDKDKRPTMAIVQNHLEKLLK